MLLSLRLSLAHCLDLGEQKLRRVGEKWGWPQAWFHELQVYLQQPRMALWEFYIRYTLKRMDAEKTLKPVMTEDEAREFYATSDYFMMRNLYHRRHTPWRRVLWLTPARGSFFEFGSGVAPISSYIAKRRPNVWYWLVDIKSPHRDYGEWRVRQAARCGAGDSPYAMAQGYAVITAVDVFEHLPDPYHVAESLAESLRTGGYMVWNIHHNPLRNDLDLSTPAQLEYTGAYLERHLEVVWRKGEFRVGRKR